MAVVNTDTDQARLAELQREAGSIASRRGAALGFGDWKRLHELARKIEALVPRIGKEGNRQPEG